MPHYARTSGHQNVLYALRDKGIDWNAKANTMIVGERRERITVLHLAAVLEDDSALKYLLDEDFAKDVDGITDLKKLLYPWLLGRTKRETWLCCFQKMGILL